MIEAPRISGTATRQEQPVGQDAADGALRLHREEDAPAAGSRNGQPVGRPAYGHVSAARMCLWLGLLALSASLVGCVVNSLLTGWMAVAGMAAIGLFYLGLSSVAASQARSPVLDHSDDAANETNGDVL